MNGVVLKGGAAQRGQIAAAIEPAKDAWRWLVRCRARSRQRHSLAELDRRLLRDIGVSEAQRMMELEKPFWR